MLAKLLYTWGLPHTSDWGVLKTNPRQLKAQVFPLSDETAAELKAATDELTAAGLWVPFTVGEDEFIYYPTFEKYQDVHKRSNNPRDGLPFPPTHPNFPEVPASSRKSLGKGSEVNGSESSESKALSENAGNGPAPSDHTADASAEKARLKAEKDLRDAERMRQQTARLEAALAALLEEDRQTADTMIQAQADEKGKPLTLLQQAQLVETYRDELADHGPQCWRECCRIALEKAHGSVAYAKGCTKTWVPKAAAPALSLVGPQVQAPASRPLDPDFAKRWDEERNARRLTDAN